MSINNAICFVDSGPVYYNWSAGVRIRSNIGQIEDWAQRNGFEEEFSQVSEKLLTAAEFLSTSKSLLFKVMEFQITSQSMLNIIEFMYTLDAEVKYTSNPAHAATSI